MGPSPKNRKQLAKVGVLEYGSSSDNFMNQFLFHFKQESFNTV